MNFLPSCVCRRYQARCVKFETLEQSLSKWLMWVKQCQTWKSISFSAVTIPGSKQFTCTVKWKEWIRVSSHICQQVPWQWYEISIVIFFFIVIILDSCVEITRDIKPLKFDEILRSWILRKTEIFDFRNWLHLSATRRLIKFSEFRIEKCTFIRTREILSRVGFTRNWLAK